MPFAATTFYDDAPPMLTAAALNKLGAGIARAQTTADAALTSALTATTSASDAVTAVDGRAKVLRTTDGAVVTGMTLTDDDLLTFTFTGVDTKLFLVTFGLVYNADAHRMGTISFAATNGHAPGSGGADTYWLSQGVDAAASQSSTQIHYQAEATAIGRRSRLPGNLGAAVTAPRVVHGRALVRNGTSTDDLIITLSVAESILADPAASGSGMQLLTGSLMTAQRLN